MPEIKHTPCGSRRIVRPRLEAEVNCYAENIMRKEAVRARTLGVCRQGASKVLPKMMHSITKTLIFKYEKLFM